MGPLRLPPNVVEHFYTGGARIAELRGIDLPSTRRPEEWLAATVHRAGEPGVGQSRTADGRLFADLVAADPPGWVGAPSEGPAGSADTGLLVKLLDAGQRLPVHVHPDRAFAGTHLHSCYGKTEAWYVLGTDGEDSAVWLGFSRPVDPAELARRVDDQDSDWLLGHLNRVPVRPGDGILVPAGAPHAIGAGVFVLEVQEPTDFSVLLEWSVTTATREESHLGLGFDLALQTLSTEVTDPAALAALRRFTDPGGRTDRPVALLPDRADPFFRLDLAAPTPGAAVAVPAGYAVAVVLSGAGLLVAAGGDEPVRLARGEVWAVPAGLGNWSASGDLTLLVCRPGTDWPGNLGR